MNPGSIVWKIAGIGGTALAAFGTRKLLGKVWEKSTHKPVPINPQQPGIGMSEALAWTIISGIGVAVAQLVVERTAANFVRNSFGEKALPKKFRVPIDHAAAGK